MKQFFLGLSFLLVNASAFSALPPLYQTTNEFKSLIESKKLTETLESGEALISIVRTQTGFLIETNKHTLQVDVVYDPAERPGPAQYHLLFKDPVKK